MAYHAGDDGRECPEDCEEWEHVEFVEACDVGDCEEDEGWERVLAPHAGEGGYLDDEAWKHGLWVLRSFYFKSLVVDFNGAICS